jgi:hypothetical protein
MNRSITVMLCTNNPDNGMDTGRCSAVRLNGDSSMQIECQYADWEPRCYVKDGELRFSRRRLPCSHETDWVGNWCWRAVQMTPAVALDFVRHLREIGWRIDEAESNFFRLWNSGETIRASDLLTALFDGPTAAEKAAVAPPLNHRSGQGGQP